LAGEAKESTEAAEGPTYEYANKDLDDMVENLKKQMIEREEALK